MHTTTSLQEHIDRVSDYVNSTPHDTTIETVSVGTFYAESEDNARVIMLHFKRDGESFVFDYLDDPNK